MLGNISINFWRPPAKQYHLESLADGFMRASMVTIILALIHSSTLTLDFEVGWQHADIRQCNVASVSIIKFYQYWLCVFLFITWRACGQKPCYLSGQFHCRHRRSSDSMIWLPTVYFRLLPIMRSLFTSLLTSNDIAWVEAARLLAPISTDPCARWKTVTWLWLYI